MDDLVLVVSGGQQGVLAAELVVERGDRHAAVGGQVAYGDPVVAVLGDQRSRALEDVFPTLELLLSDQIQGAAL